MAEYTYECELCHQRITFNEPKPTPIFIPHACITYEDEDNNYIDVIDCGGECYRVWQPIPFYMKGKM